MGYQKRLLNISFFISLCFSALLSAGELPETYRSTIQTLRNQLTLTQDEKEWLKNNPVIRFGVDAGYAPYTYTDDREVFIGLVADYLNLAGEVLPVKFELQQGLSWSEVLQKTQQKELDLIATASITPERNQYLEFTDFFIATPLVITTRAENKSEISTPTELTGRKVALVRNYASSDRVYREYPDIIPYVTETPLEALQALASGDVDAYVGVIGVNNYLARTHGLTNLTVAGRYDLTPGGQRFAIRKDWPVLRDILDKVFEQLSQQDINRIHERWIPSASHTLSLPGIQLSEEEKRYLSQKSEITMCVDPNWMPYEKIDEKGQHIGIAADYMAMFAKMLNTRITLIPTQSWAESETFARNRKCDLLSFLNYSDRRSRFLNFTDPYVEAPVVLVSRQDVTYIDGIRSLSGETFAMVKGYVYEDLIREQYPSVNIRYVESMDEGLKLISAGKIYTTIGSLYIITSRIQKLGLTNLKIAGHTEFTNQFRVGVRNDDPILFNLFQKAVQARDPEQENSILRRWISVRLEKTVDYTLLWQVILIASGLLLLVMYRNKIIRRYNQKLEEKNRLLEHLSHTDPLTGACNRVRIDEVLETEIIRSLRYQHIFSLIVLDIDHFKHINDNWGHQMGDKVLVSISRLIEAQIRSSDTFGRWGGEEFLIICPETSPDQAVILAEKLRSIIQHELATDPEPITASFGVSGYHSGDQSKDIIARADSAMYQAKSAGRNRVCLWPDHLTEPTQSAPFQISFPQSDRS